MTDQSEAFALVGEFQFHFANLEQALDSCVAKVLNLDGAAAAILCGALDFYRKIIVVRAAVDGLFSARDIKPASKILNKIGNINNPHRQTVIHSRFEPGRGGGVTFYRITPSSLEKRDIVWSRKDFDKHYKDMGTLVLALAKLEKRLTPFTPSLDFTDKRNAMYVALL